MKYIQHGWEAYRRIVVPSDASEVQVRETRKAFYAGASVLFETIMHILDPGLEPTEADLQKMTDLHDELVEFGQNLDQEVFRTTDH